MKTIAGTGTRGSGGDDGPAIEVRLDDVRALVVGPDGSIFVSDTGANRIRRIAPG